MNETTLPPSPNWYLNNILACSYDGTVAWGARNLIVIVKCNNNDNTLKYSLIRNAHRDRVTSLSFTPQFEQLNSNFLASTGDDENIKIWNVDTLSVAHIYSLGNGKQGIGVAWSYRDPLLVYCLTSDSCVLAWNAYFNTISSISLGKKAATCISSCPHDKNLVAVGSKDGLVHIVNFHGKGTVVYKLRGHDTEVVDLSWCPTDENVLNENHKKDLLLASGGRDRSIFIWRAGGDGRYEMEITLPASPLDSGRHKSKLNASIGNWIAVRWVKPKLLMASSSWGEMISWDLSTITKNKPACKLVHSCHARGLFCIKDVPVTVQNTIDDWRQKERVAIWTLAQDRQVVCCSIEGADVKIEYNIPTQGGYVYCIAACPLDTCRLAFGVGDSMLRLWNLSETHSTKFDIVSLWQMIKGKVRAVSWHPEKENLLAYATGEGRVGVFDVNSNKPPTLYRQYHRNTVYVLGWGPNPQNKKQYVLYSSGEGELVYYDPKESKREPTSVIKKDCTEFSWKPDFSCLGVGFENGSISFYNPDFVVCGHAKLNTKRVHCLSWHPESTATDLTVSALKHYLAVAFNSTTITILDLSNYMNHLNELKSVSDNDHAEEKQVSYNVHEVIATLNGHSDKVVCLAWSPHFSGYLISGSYDNTVQVWNVETQEVMGTYTGHCGPVLCCIWSPVNPDFIISGSADFTVRIWKIQRADATTPKERTFKKSVSRKNKKKQGKSDKMDNFQNDLANLTDTTSKCSISETKMVLTKEPRKKKCERSAYFAKSTKMMNDKTVLLNAIASIASNGHSLNIDSAEEQQDTSCPTEHTVFSRKEDLLLLLANEKSDHSKEGRHNIATEVDVWCDNLKENLEQATNEKRLNDFLVSLAPSLSIKTWKEMCEIYANQLAIEGNPHKAVAYLLCIHKTYKAIEVFEEAHLYKEAYALGKCKLDADDPVLESVLRNWANHNVDNGQFEQAAHIYAILGDFPKATAYLARRKDAAALMTAAEVARLSNDDILSKSLVEQAISAALTNAEYDLARTIIKKFPSLKYREVHVYTVEKFMKMITRKTQSETIQEWLNGKSDNSLLQDLQNLYGSCESYYHDLRQNQFCHAMESEQSLWITVSHEIAMAVTCNKKAEELKHIVAALSIISQYDTKNKCNFLIEVLIKLDTKSPMNEESIYAKIDCPASTSLRAYLCFGLLSWLVDEAPVEIINENALVFVNLINDLIEDVLNQEAIKQWSIGNEISKLETQLASVLCKTKEEDGVEPEQDTTTLVHDLDLLRTQKKQFLEERVCIPNPAITYSKANELVGKLIDKDVKDKFESVISKAWKSAIS